MKPSAKQAGPFCRRMEATDTHWLIYSRKWPAWYRPGSAGYTNDVLAAGLFTKEEAAAHYRPDQPRRWRVTEPFPLSSVKRMLVGKVAEAEKRVREAKALLTLIERKGDEHGAG